MKIRATDEILQERKWSERNMPIDDLESMPPQFSRSNVATGQQTGTWSRLQLQAPPSHRRRPIQDERFVKLAMALSKLTPSDDTRTAKSARLPGSRHATSADPVSRHATSTHPGSRHYDDTSDKAIYLNIRTGKAVYSNHYI